MDLTYKLIFFSIAPVKFPHLQGVKNLICYWFICYFILLLAFNGVIYLKWNSLMDIAVLLELPLCSLFLMQKYKE